VNEESVMSLIRCPECSHGVSDQAPTCPSCGYPLKEQVREPEFRAYRKRVLIGTLFLCLIGLLVGIAMKLPAVWGLSIAGIVIAGFKLKRTVHHS
jgi:hypothetical protein